MRTLRIGDIPVATYVASPELDIRLAPRPYLHPVRTLGGVVVTDALCFDHPWHLGASLTVSDVNGVNVWGGRTYVRDRGYEWLPDHGRIRHDAWLAPDHNTVDSGFAERLTWCDGTGREILREHRSVSAVAAPHGWELRFSYALSPIGESPVVLGSPATHGRPGGAGYGGFFWRAAAGAARAFTRSTDSASASSPIPPPTQTHQSPDSPDSAPRSPASAPIPQSLGSASAPQSPASAVAPQSPGSASASAPQSFASQSLSSAPMSFPPAAPFPGVPKSDFSVFKSSSGPHGSDEPWVALTVGGAYTLVFRGLAGEDRWFVRTDEYAGVCAALAFEHELVIPPGGSLSRDLRVLVADGVLAPEQISDR